jgi:hypothetical protein
VPIREARNGIQPFARFFEVFPVTLEELRHEMNGPFVWEHGPFVPL